MKRKEPKQDRQRAKALRRKYGINDAGKGDAPRPQDAELFQLGQNILFAETEEEKKYWENEWNKARKRKQK